MFRFLIYLLSAFVVILGSLSQAKATPATQLELSYKDQMIHIRANHPSDHLDSHYIQRVVVMKNLKEKQYFYFPRQTSANQFKADLNYPANPGDYLEIEIYCSQGGVARGKIDVTEQETRKEPK